MREQTIAEIHALTGQLHKVAGMIRQDTNDVAATNDHIQVIRHYNHLRLAAADIKEARGAISKMEEHLSREVVPDVMRAANVKTITLEGVGRVTVSYRFSCSILDGMKEQGMTYLRDTGNEGLIQETVNSSTLSAFAKGWVMEQGKELPEDVFKTSQSPYTSITEVK